MKSVLLLTTGGTIASRRGTDGLCPQMHPDELLAYVEGLREYFHIDTRELLNLDSSNIQADEWLTIARSIYEALPKYDGIVVTHGTDTMAYTASALSFMLEGLMKPVIITGSQLPIGEVRTDGEENLITALQIAAARDASDGGPMVREVAILFENYLWRGCRASKRSADNFNAFISNNYPRLAHIGLGIDFNVEALARPNTGKKLRVQYNLDRSITIIDLFPGLCETTLRHLLHTPGIKGVVMRTYGAGNAPTAPWFLDAVRDAIDRGIIILNVTQCVDGSVRSNRYVGGDMLAAAGVLSGYDMTLEAATTKMMVLFGRGSSPRDVVISLSRPICGEMTVL